MTDDDRWAIFDRAGEEIVKWVRRFRCGEREPPLPRIRRPLDDDDDTPREGLCVAPDAGSDDPD